MSGSVNKVILIGHLGGDPELKYMPSGDPVANFTIATNESFRDRDGNLQEKTEWHKIVAFKKTAEICGEYLKKGRQVYIEGKIQTRSWEDNNGVKRYTTEIVAFTVQMLGRKGEGEDSNIDRSSQGSASKESEGNEDDLPF